MPKSSAPRQPKVDLTANTVFRGDRIELRGRGFLDCAVFVEIDGKIAKDLRIARGFVVPDGLRPHGTGEFVAFVGTLTLAPGRHTIAVESRFEGKELRIERDIRVRARPTENGEEKGDEQPFDRTVDLFNRRFGLLGTIPPGVLAARRASLQRLRKGQHAYSRIITPGCNWTVLGPSPGISSGSPGFHPLSGKVRALAVDPIDGNTVYLGGAVGGVWKTTNGGESWLPMSDYQSTLAIGAIAIDPADSSHIYAGTGVYPDSGYLDYFGNGILESTDGGATWMERATATFERQAISSIRFDPTDSTHMLLSSSLGVYESTDAGGNWRQLYAGLSSGVVLIRTGGVLSAVATISGSLYKSTYTSGAWQAWTKITSSAIPTSTWSAVIAQSHSAPQTLYAALAGYGADDLAGIAVSTDGGATWTARNNPTSPSNQLWHAFQLGVHPTDPNTVYYGEVNIWKTTDGGMSWTAVTAGTYADQNAFAFDPSAADTLWAGNDGGVWRSTDGAATWESRNASLALSKCIQLAQHPTWDSVLLVTSQDDGAYRYQGQAGWELVGGGDTGPVGIDPTTPTTMYVGGHGVSIGRSDNAGAPYSFNDKTGAMSGQALFYPPFLIDPNGSNVCYFGAGALWRSADRADTWVAATNQLDPNNDPIVGQNYAISGIAVQAGNPDRVFVCSSHGKVYSIERTGADWTIPNVTTTEITGTGLPVGASLSDIVVDSAGTLWVTVSSLLIPLLENEFTNDHVYRLASGSTVWESRSNGLAVANPANTIVIDPTDDNVLYVGCDSSVFMTTDAGGTWTIWDDGLPNAPVYDLVLHQPRRLLRAATFGRSVWERPLDVAVAPAVDIYFRDNIVDTGRVQPTPSGVSDPFTPSTLDWWWQSEDIKVDGPQPSYQTGNPITSYIDFEQTLLHTSPRRGEVNRFYTQIQNRGPSSAHNVMVRAFFVDAHAGLPTLPSDFWSNGSPFTADPSASTYVPVGPMRTISTLYPGAPAIVEWDYTVPLSAPEHSCLFVLATCDENVLDGSRSLDPNWLVQNSKQITLKNLQVLDAVPGTPHMMMMRLFNDMKRDARYNIDVHWETVPVRSIVDVAFELLRGSEHVVEASSTALKRGGIATPVARGLFPPTVADRCGGAIRIDRGRVYRAERGERSTSTIAGVRVPAESSIVILLRLVLPKDAAQTACRFDIVQRSGKRVVGGNAYEIRQPRAK